ncbi:tetratricopeptide repeat protein [Companilactobacillus sp.]|jgi:TPR repeat protein|uniref:tetratricopeptide repeat protein n=1 Tax=Companilactobacillus sp. TaxID=2767905 RepID=UPI0025BC8C77|nr:tetratricopeptide repeat protein [Companilactobacillus sp.]MCH4009018.1 sel1 repeat family protein [Companilactobacillus sp.]MCH4050803.1 sel1 repeat family protein [Companilactobacillus sp.]MCH4076960.1 sel1 repeat family protein [Companilactobacillus sp.]MCH4125536.1 sel1 repeat family protein [Companilactobacillus sp.]MCI1311245.1 sel1 repeat family protein [Companilactobacillus sp.]
MKKFISLINVMAVATVMFAGSTSVQAATTGTSTENVSTSTMKKEFDAAMSSTKKGDFSSQKETIEKLAEEGYGPAQALWCSALLHGTGGVSVNYDQALEYALKAIDQGQTGVPEEIAGIVYLYGYGSTKADYSKAMKYFQSASKTDMKAYRYLGYIYEQGKGVTKNMTTAIKYFEKGAEQGDITSQYELGKIYETGNGVTQDYAKAYEYYKESAARGDNIAAPAMAALGNLYEHGYGVTKNIATAESYYKKAYQAMADAS